MGTFTRYLPALVLMASWPTLAIAQRAELSEADVAAAIEAGAKAKGKEQGLRIKEGGFMRAAGAPTTGFSLVVYTPTSWIREQASRAAKQYKPFTIAEASPVEPVLRVVAHPDLPVTMNAEARRRASSVEHVVIQNAARTEAIQPIGTEPFEAEISNALGAELSYRGLIAKFPLDKLRGLRGPAGNAPFVITVVSTGGADAMGRSRTEKPFEIEAKQLKDLP